MRFILTYFYAIVKKVIFVAELIMIYEIAMLDIAQKFLINERLNITFEKQ